MAEKKGKTKPQMRKKLNEIATSSAKLTKRQLRALQEIAEVLGESFAQEVGKVGLLEVAVQDGQEDIVEFLLDSGVDPNALPVKATSGARPLGRPFARGSRLKDAQRVALCTRLLRAGADPNDVYPHPKHASYNRPAWGTRKSALDLALQQRSDAASVLMAADLSELTRASALSVAVHASSMYTVRPQLSESQRERGIALVKELLESFGASPAPDRWGVSPVHVAGIAGNVEALRLLLEHEAPVDIRFEGDVCYSDDRHLAPIESGSYKSVQFPPGASPLDAIALLRRNLEAQLDLARTKGDLQPNFEDLPERLAAMDEAETMLRAHGAVLTGATVQLPEFTGPIDAVLEPLIGDRYAQRQHELNFVNMGPWTYLIAVGELFRDALGSLEAHAPVDPIAYLLLGWHTKQVVARYNDPDYRQDEIDVQIDPENYPPDARKLLREQILGIQGDDVLVLKRTPEGARLYRIDPQRVKDEGTLFEGLLDAFSARVTPSGV